MMFISWDNRKAAFQLCLEPFLTKKKHLFVPDLVNVFEVFLPQLLLYPNPSDPLNGEAAALLMRDRAAYEQRVKGIEHFFIIPCNGNKHAP